MPLSFSEVCSKVEHTLTLRLPLSVCEMILWFLWFFWLNRSKKKCLAMTLRWLCRIALIWNVQHKLNCIALPNRVKRKRMDSILPAHSSCDITGRVIDCNSVSGQTTLVLTKRVICLVLSECLMFKVEMSQHIRGHWGGKSWKWLSKLMSVIILSTVASLMDLLIDIIWGIETRVIVCFNHMSGSRSSSLFSNNKKKKLLNPHNHLSTWPANLDAVCWNIMILHQGQLILKY